MLLDQRPSYHGRQNYEEYNRVPYPQQIHSGQEPRSSYGGALSHLTNGNFAEPLRRNSKNKNRTPTSKASMND